MKKMMLMLVAIVFAFVNAYAQNKTVKGKVIDDSTQVTLPDATIAVVAGSFKKTIRTDANGNFTIVIPQSNDAVTFNVSYAGYENLKITSKESFVTLAIKRTASDLDDVVVIGYQTVKRKDVLASVASVGAKDLKDVPINSAAEALNGRLAGVTATAAEGSPDAEIRVRVRGGMSITGDNSPLYIVDGVQVENGLNSVVIQDIQSIDVLKDAAATAIYGARGANGVVIITTKSGKTGKPRVTYNMFVGVRYLPKTLKVLDPYEFVVYNYERSRGNSTDSSSFANFFGSTWDTLSVYKNANFIDWQEELMGRTAIAQTHNLGLSGGTKRTTYNLSYTHTNDKAIIIMSEFKRHLINFKADHKFTDKLKLAFSGRYSNQNVYGAGVSDERGSSYSRLRNAVKYRPFLADGQDLDDDDPAAVENPGNGLSLINPYRLASGEFRRKTTDQINLSLAATYNINKRLSFKTTFGYNTRNLVDRQFSDSTTSYSINFGSRKPIVNLDTVQFREILWSNTLTYTLNNYKKKHSFSVLLGQEILDQRTSTYQSYYNLLPNFIDRDEAFKNPSLGTYLPSFPRTIKVRATLASYFGRISYDYKKKYYFTANLRADGSSKFFEGMKWGLFPSASVAWRAKSEKFLKEVNWLSDLKFRYGIGTVGNNRIQDYLFLTTFRNDLLYYGIGNQVVPGYTSNSLVNQNLTWEATESNNWGVDISLFKGKIDITVDYYINNSRNLLLDVPIASTYGFATQTQNVGRTQNRGVEFQINATVLRNKNIFNWTVGYNMSFNRNEVKALGTNQTQFFPSPSWGVSGQPTDYLVRIGQPLGTMWGLVNDGFYTVNDFDYNTATGQYTLKAGVVNAQQVIGVVQPGSIKFKDLNGDGVIDLNNDRTIIGNAQPKFTGGFTNNITYKNWDFSVFLNFSYGNTVYNANKIEFTNGYTNRSNMLDIMRNRWRTVDEFGNRLQRVVNDLVYGVAPDQLAAANANATLWQPLVGAGAFVPHSWAMEDGSFLRVNTVTVGYTLPVKSAMKLGISKARFYLSGNNLAILTSYSGYDPEVSVRRSPLTPGLDYSAYPRSRSFVFGLNVTF
jgi:TonB-linked SusC/RagA family outer membrane protein